MNYLEIAYEKALKSPDPSTQNGAVVINSYGSVVTGFNHFYKGFEPKDESRETKLLFIEHAERDCIYNSVSLGVNLTNATMFCPFASCMECARALAGSGIGTLIIHKERMSLCTNYWRESIVQALDCLRKSGILVHEYSGPVNAEPVLVAGKLWSPRSMEYVSD